MILIRGIKGEAYARKIEEGIVDCRDILSALLYPPQTGYEYSDYYEKNLVRALAYLTGRQYPDLHDSEFLYSILIDYYIPHIYVTYFHILNSRSLEWLDKFEDDYYFIAMDVNLDRITKTAIGNEFFGDKMTYVNNICESEQNGMNGFYVACMCSIEDLFENKNEMVPSLRVYNTLAFSLLHREQDEKFTDIENEFRIIAYDCPRVKNGKLIQIPRETMIYGTYGIKYKGILEAATDTVFKSNSFAFSNPNKMLSSILRDEHGGITIDSKFKPIDIRKISNDYRFLGGKAECKKYIKEMLIRKPKEKYVNRTVLRKHNLNDENMKDAKYVSSYEKVEY